MRVMQREALCTPFLLPPPAAKEKNGSIWGHPKPRQGLRPLDPRLARMPMCTHKGCRDTGTNTPREPRAYHCRGIPCGCPGGEGGTPQTPKGGEAPWTPA